MCINWGRSACVQPARSYAHQLNPEFLQERPGLKARVVDGKKMASTIHSEVAAEVRAMVQKGQRSVEVGHWPEGCGNTTRMGQHQSTAGEDPIFKLFKYLPPKLFSVAEFKSKGIHGQLVRLLYF